MGEHESRLQWNGCGSGAPAHAEWRGEPIVVCVGNVTADFSSVVGEFPMTGRTFLPADDQHGARPVAVLSHRPGAGGQPSMSQGCRNHIPIPVLHAVNHLGST